MKLTAEDFDAWRANPLTQLILDRYIGEEMSITRDQHNAEAWEGPVDVGRHAALRERYETLEFVQGLTFKDLDEWLREKQERPE
jgi:hypothetical protein